MNEIKCVIHDQSDYSDKFLGQPRVCVWIPKLKEISNGYKYLKVRTTGIEDDDLLITFHKHKPKEKNIITLNFSGE